MENLKTGIKDNYFLFVSEWEGLSDNPGSLGFFIYPDGSYIKKNIFFKKPENNLVEEGVLEQNTLRDINTFISDRIKKDSTRRIHDYGCTIEVVKDDQTIKMENDMEQFNDLIKLIPFRDSSIR